MVYSIQGIRKKVFIFTIKLVIIRTKKSYMEYFFTDTLLQMLFVIREKDYSWLVSRQTDEFDQLSLIDYKSELPLGSV